MNSQEELRLKEQMWQQEMLIWKNKYQSLEEKVNKMKEVHQPENTMDELTIVEEEIASAAKGVTDMERMISGWFQALSDKIEEDRQHSRKNNLLVHGFRYIPNDLNDSEFIIYIAQQINYLFPSLSGTIYPSHIDDAHILNTKKKRGSHVVIIKFVNRWIKDLILKSKNDLINSGLSVTEHLTENSINMLASAKKLVGEENTWVHKTIVYARHNGKKHKIKNTSSIEILKRCVEENPTTNNPPITNEVHSDRTNLNSQSHTREHHNSSPPFRGRSRGIPSYYGRGRGGYFRGNYNFNNPHHYR